MIHSRSSPTCLLNAAVLALLLIAVTAQANHDSERYPPPHPQALRHDSAHIPGTITALQGSESPGHGPSFMWARFTPRNPNAEGAFGACQATVPDSKARWVVIPQIDEILQPLMTAIQRLDGKASFLIRGYMGEGEGETWCRAASVRVPE